VIEEILRESVGKRLTSAGGTFHVLEGRVSAEPLALWLGFEGMRSVRFSGTSDGWHLIADEAEPENVDMQESGSIRFFDLAELPIISHVIGMVVRDAWLVLSPGPDDVIGFRLDFESCTIRVLNWGDTICLGSEFPKDADLGKIGERRVR
jgi:hypothetical protein